MKHLHILGICGTFMGSLAQLAKALGFKVTGSDLNVYPPMSTQLSAAGIELIEGWDPAQLNPVPDLVIVGNVISRGNPVMEAVLNRGIAYTSGPAWLAEHVLQKRWVLAVAGTHGKTTTSSMLACILENAAMQPGFLIGGVPNNFDVSARLGGSDFFVIEADEYDSAFFDKRSKFVHYHPNTLIMNNLEYDHADIFPDLAAIERQFHHLVRTVPEIGLLVVPEQDAALKRVLAMGQWTPAQSFGDGGQWQAQLLKADGSEFDVYLNGEKVAEVRWGLSGQHNVNNALAAMAAAKHVGAEPDIAAEALCAFQNVKRRMELLASVDGVNIYDDFAHHPTAIKTTLEGLRAKVGDEPIIAVIEPRSNTMKQGVHKDALLESCAAADEVMWYQPPSQGWSLQALLTDQYAQHHCFDQLDGVVEHVVSRLRSADQKPAHLVIMSNGGFGGIHSLIIHSLQGH